MHYNWEDVTFLMGVLIVLRAPIDDSTNYNTMKLYTVFVWIVKGMLMRVSQLARVLRVPPQLW